MSERALPCNAQYRRSLQPSDSGQLKQVHRQHQQQRHAASGADAGFFQLYTAANVGPSAQWTLATNQPFLSKGQWMMTQPVTTGGRFYRLQTQ